MKVTGVKTYVIENESAPRSGGGEETGNWYIGGKYFLILELSTDEGIIGLGEKLTGSSFTGNMTWKDFKSQIQLVHETVEAFVIGKNPFDIEKIYYDMYAGRHDYRLPSLHFGMVLSGIEMALRRILVSPDFLFRESQDPKQVAVEGIYQISDLELASRLSFLLWSSVPDKELLDLAESGRLSDPSILDQQHQRM